MPSIGHITTVALKTSDAYVHPVWQVNFTAFSAAAAAAFNMTLDPPFDAFSNDVTFLLGAFLFEDIGVTAYKVGACPENFC